MSSGAKLALGIAKTVVLTASVFGLCCGCSAGRALDLGGHAGVGGEDGEDGSELVRVIDGGVALAVDEERVYWVELGAEGKARAASCTKNSCSSIINYSAEPYYGYEFQLAAAAGELYWVGSSSDEIRFELNRCKVTGCDGPPEILAGDVLDMAVDAEAVYYVHDPSDGSGNIIRRVAHGASVETTTDVAVVPSDILSLTVHRGNVYWLAVLPSGLQSIHSVSAGGGPPKMVITDLHRPTAPASDGTYLYWASRVLAGNISRCTLPACADATVVWGQVVAPDPLLVDGSDLYWGHDGEDTSVLARFRLGSSSAQTIIRHLRLTPYDEHYPALVRAVASDGEAVYALTAPLGESNPVTDIRRVWK